MYLQTVGKITKRQKVVADADLKGKVWGGCILQPGLPGVISKVAVVWQHRDPMSGQPFPSATQPCPPLQDQDQP